ncbi:MAG: hypothetical protein RJB43_1575, partial [Verrucomicrobiota bacterium]
VGQRRVGVGRGDERGDIETHTAGELHSADVTEITRRDHDAHATTRSQQALGVEGERDLCDQANGIDGVGREQRAVTAQRLIGERPLHHRLTVIERAIDRQRDDSRAGASDL